MDRSHSAGWQVAQQLAECSDFHDIEARHRLLAFAILHCESAAIEQLVTYRYTFNFNQRQYVVTFTNCIYFLLLLYVKFDYLNLFNLL